MLMSTVCNCGRPYSVNSLLSIEMIDRDDWFVGDLSSSRKDALLTIFSSLINAYILDLHVCSKGSQENG